MHLAKTERKRQVGVEMMHLSEYFHTLKKKNLLYLNQIVDAKMHLFILFLHTFTPYFVNISYLSKKLLYHGMKERGTGCECKNATFGNNKADVELHVYKKKSAEDKYFIRTMILHQIALISLQSLLIFENLVHKKHFVLQV